MEGYSMDKKTILEKDLKPANGFLMLFVIIAGVIVSTTLFVLSIVSFAAGSNVAGVAMLIASLLGLVVFGIMFAGLKIVRPNEARVFTLFGTYHGTVKATGYHFVNPFCVSFNPVYDMANMEAVSKAKEAAKEGRLEIARVAASKAVSLKKQTLNNDRQKVNDVLGNPVIIGAIVIWYVEDPTQAVFSVEDYTEYLSIQTDSTIRNTARLYPYDVFAEGEYDDSIREKTLRGSSLEIAETMKSELQKRVADAGLFIDEVRITHLAYAEEIAAAMLQRQQAAAIIAARQKIVDGAVGMVKMAIDKLGDDNIVILDEERKATMVSNLLVVLCGNRDAQPIINSGTIY
jgi:regulator of protease activity HflC (stomatin/prohibitin superfamily)